MDIVTRAEARKNGLPKYFTGKACVAGHVAERYTPGANCVICQGMRARDPEALRIARAALYQKNKAAHAQACKLYREENREKIRAVRQAWEALNAEALKEKRAKYQRENRAAATERQARRRAAERQATPVWADRAAIKAIYIEAGRLGLNVDHEIPLAGELVCGLHVHNNLRMLTATANKQKYNRFSLT